MIKAVIIDDELKGATLLQHKLSAFADRLVVERIFSDPFAALQVLPSISPDIVFLDVEMPLMDGFKFLENLGNIDFEVIFVTAYNVYAIEALRADALDYLLKPVDTDELTAAIEKLSKRIEWKKRRQKQGIHMGSACASRLALSTSEGIYFVRKDEIVKIEAMSNYSVFYFSAGNKIIVSRTLKEFEGLLDADRFLRINRSTIVNLSCVIRYKKGEGGTLQLVDGSELEVSPTKKSLLMELLSRT